MKEALAAQPAPHVVRTLSKTYLAQARAACARLEDPSDEEALHDFRVALRRLRSLLRAHKGYARRWLSKKLIRRIKDLASDTGAARDTEVQLAWLRQRKDRIKPHQRPGFVWMTQRLERRLEEEYADLREELPRAFRRLDKRLQARLETDTGDEAPVFGEVTALRLEEAAEAFREHLARIHGEAAEKEVHRARITGKRLRYLLEPVADELEGGRDLVKELKELQNLMGEIHDLQVFAEELGQASEEAGAERMRRLIELTLNLGPEDPAVETARRQDERAGLMSLAREVRDRDEHLMSRLAAKWDDGDVDRFLEQLERIRESLLISASPVSGGTGTPS
ncbi:MAG: CHAD domain-containing protein [Ectothiorhodospira sp.]